MQRKDEKILWEDGDLAGKLEGLGLEKDSGFGGPSWYRSVETTYEEEGRDRII